MAFAARPSFDSFGYMTLKDLLAKVEFEIRAGKNGKNFEVIALALLGELAEGVTIKTHDYQVQFIPWLRALVNGDVTEFEKQLELYRLISEFNELTKEQVTVITRDVAAATRSTAKNALFKIVQMDLVLQMLGLTWQGYGELNTPERLSSINHMMTESYNLNAIITGNNSFRQLD